MTLLNDKELETILLDTITMLFLILRWILKWFFWAEPKPLCDVYRQPGKWYYLKYLVAYIILRFRKLKNRSQKISSQNVGYGMKSRPTEAAMECPQKLSEHPNAIDAVYISGYSQDGCYFVSAISRWPHRVISGFWFLWIPKVGLLTSPKLPNTVLLSNEDDKFSVDGLHIEPLEPMKRWKVTYNGDMKLHDTGKILSVQVDLDFSSDLPCFDFDTDIPSKPMARALAREPWNLTYFDNLRNTHQTHYEQMGSLWGNCEVEGFGKIEMHMAGYRDHSYGYRREWKYMHRYGLHSVALEDGTLFTVGIISQPVTLSTLELGYLYTPYGKLHGVEWCDLQLHRHGEDGIPPTDYGFKFKAGKIIYDVQVKVLTTSEFYVGQKWEARFLERFCIFTVNGIKGRGISEWEYKNNIPRSEIEQEITNYD